MVNINQPMEAESTLKPRERAYYESVLVWLETLLKPKTSTLHLEVTADRPFSNTLQAQIDQHREIIFSFLKDARPDITGFLKLKPDSMREFIVVEVKLTSIKLDDIYQTRKYAELFDAVRIARHPTRDTGADCAPRVCRLPSSPTSRLQASDTGAVA